MSDTNPAATTPTAEESRKAILKSKTFWLNALAMLSVLIPAMQQFIAENPESPFVALGALNVLLRFATKGKVNIFGENTTPPAGGLMAFLVLGTMAGLMGIVLPSCSPSSIAASVKVRDPKTGATAALSYRPDQKVRGSVTVPVHDAETGELLGVTDVKFGQAITGTK